MDAQTIYCVNSPHGAIDIFRVVHGMGCWNQSRQDAVVAHTGSGLRYLGISDADLLQCQLRLDPAYQKVDRIATLRRKLGLSP